MRHRKGGVAANAQLRTLAEARTTRHGSHAAAANDPEPGVCVNGLDACSSDGPVTARTIQRYTGVELCPAATVRDLTSKEERDTTPGFSFHAAVELTPECTASFERQLAKLSPVECTPERVTQLGCFVQDAYRASGRHTSIMVHPARNGRFDIRFSS